MSDLHIKLIKSPIGTVPKHRRTLKALGLKKLQQTVQHTDTPQIRGMVNQVQYLLEVSEGEGSNS